MAYITADRTKAIKKELTKKYPHIRFSVRREHYSSVHVAILESDIDFSDLLEGRSYTSINQYLINRYDKPYGKHNDLFAGMFKIINEGNYDRSDIMTDYFDVGFYVTMQIGKWDKPYVCTKERAIASAK